MVLLKRFIPFDDALLERHPDLKEVLKPNDQYPELKHLLKKSSGQLPVGSLNTKLIMLEGQIVERVYKTPKGHVVSLFSKSSNRFFDNAA